MYSVRYDLRFFTSTAADSEISFLAHLSSAQDELLGSTNACCPSVCCQFYYTTGPFSTKETLSMTACQKPLGLDL